MSLVQYIDSLGLVKKKICTLTDDVQRDEYAPHWLCAHLALVYAGISFLRPFDVQRPLIRVRLVVDGLETLIAGVRVRAYSQYMNVPVSYPRHLKTKPLIISNNNTTPVFSVR